MVAVPRFESDIASPWLPNALLIVAIEVGSAVHTAKLVRFCVFPSVNVPVATNAVSICSGRLMLEGVTAIEFNGLPSTTRVALLLFTKPRDAVIVELPSWTAVAVLLVKVATFVLEEFHVTRYETGCVPQLA